VRADGDRAERHADHDGATRYGAGDIGASRDRYTVAHLDADDAASPRAVERTAAAGREEARDVPAWR